MINVLLPNGPPDIYVMISFHFLSFATCIITNIKVLLIVDKKKSAHLMTMARTLLAHFCYSGTFLKSYKIELFFYCFISSHFAALLIICPRFCPLLSTLHTLLPLSICYNKHDSFKCKLPSWYLPVIAASATLLRQFSKYRFCGKRTVINIECIFLTNIPLFFPVRRPTGWQSSGDRRYWRQVHRHLQCLGHHVRL